MEDEMLEMVTILVIADNGFLAHSGCGIAHVSHFPGAAVGQVWEIETKGFKILSARRVDNEEDKTETTSPE